MARNWIQFQKGYSLTQFVEEYGSEEQCMDALFRWRWPNGFVCPRCDHTGYGHVQSRALYQCHGCRYQVSLTAGTILVSTKLALHTWFMAMYLMTQTKNGISALELSRQLGVSYNTAWSLEHKLMQVMKERDDTRPLGGSVQLDDAYWGGERRGGKRGRGAPGKTPFVAAVELNPKGRPVRMRLSRVGAFQSDEIAAWAKCCLEPGTVVFCDALGCFSAVQRASCFHQPFATGGGPASAKHPALSWVKWENGRRPFLRWPNLYLVGPLAALIVLYLMSGSLDFPSGWIWEGHSAVLLALKIPVVYLTEFGALALLLLVLRPELRREPFFVAGVATLLLLPLVFFGMHNVLLMRGGMPALLVLCYYCADVIARDGREIASAGPNFRRFDLAGVIMVLCVGALTPGIELARAIRYDDIAFRYERSGYTTFALPIQVQHERTAPEIPDLLRRLLGKADAGPRREEAELVVRAGFDVYLYGKERHLVHVKEHCRQDDLESVVLEVIRSDASPRESVVEMRSMGDACGALRRLPRGAVAAIRTGQRRQGEDGWMVEILFDEAGRMVRVNRE